MSIYIRIHPVTTPFLQFEAMHCSQRSMLCIGHALVTAVYVVLLLWPMLRLML